MKHSPLSRLPGPPCEHNSRRRLGRCRLPLAAALCALTALCLWAGAGLPLPSIPKAEAGTATATGAHSAPLSEERPRLLQSSVDSLALSLRGVFNSLPDAASQEAALAKALDALTFDLGEGIYFTAWQGTRMLHSPATPDTAGMDFADARDARGATFVQALEGAAASGGGFVQATLPPYAENRLSPDRAPTPVSQLAYARQIPDSPWHIAAFMPVTPTAASGKAFSSVWASVLPPNNAAAERDLRTGLCLSGASFAGLAGVLLLPRRRGEE